MMSFTTEVTETIPFHKVFNANRTLSQPQIGINSVDKIPVTMNLPKLTFNDSTKLLLLYSQNNSTKQTELVTVSKIIFSTL